MSRRQVAATVAVMATTIGGIATFAAPANAATGPTAKLKNGIVTVAGTAARDVVDIEMSHDRGFTTSKSPPPGSDSTRRSRRWRR